MEAQNDCMAMLAVRGGGASRPGLQGSTPRVRGADEAGGHTEVRSLRDRARARARACVGHTDTHTDTHRHTHRHTQTHTNRHTYARTAHFHRVHMHAHARTHELSRIHTRHDPHPSPHFVSAFFSRRRYPRCLALLQQPGLLASTLLGLDLDLTRMQDSPASTDAPGSNSSIGA
jgi:hypothetical protein